MKSTVSLPKFSSCSVRQTLENKNSPVIPTFDKIVLLDRLLTRQIRLYFINFQFDNTLKFFPISLLSFSSESFLNCEFETEEEQVPKLLSGATMRQSKNQTIIL